MPTGRGLRTALALCLVALSAASAAGGAELRWTQSAASPAGPDSSGSLVAVVAGKLVVAGGVRRGAAEAGDVSVLREAWVLDEPAGEWHPATPLPEPLAFGGAASFGDFAVFAGGWDGAAHRRTAYRVHFADGKLAFQPLPPLPEARAYAGAARLGSRFYLAGGLHTQGGTDAVASTVFLDLDAAGPSWQAGPEWPGPGRILAPLVAQDGALFLFGGSALQPVSGRPSLALDDAYRLDSDKQWKRIADLPAPAPGTTAASLGPTHIAVLARSADTGAAPVPLAEDQRATARKVRVYHTVTDTWVDFGETPAIPGLASAVAWRGGLALPAGGFGAAGSRPPLWFAELEAAPSGFATVDYATLLGYFSVLVCMGIYFAGKGSTTDDFFLAGRRMPWWATGLSIFGTQLSSISFMAVPAKVYATDWVYFLLQMTIVLVAFPVVFCYLPYFRRIRMTSAYEFLEHRFNLPVRLYASASFVLYQVGRMAIVLFLPAIALATVTGVSVYACILAMGALATLYTVMGGMKAVIWTDVVQVFVLYGGAALSLAILLSRTEGGLLGLVSAGLEYDKFHMFNWTWDWTTTAVWVVLVGNLFLNLVPYTSDQAVVQRYFTTKDERAAARSIWTNAILIVPSTLTLFLLGTGLWAFYRANPGLLDPTLPTDSIFPLFIAQQLPAGVAGLLIAAVFAASMSTLDSSLNSVSTALVTDFYGRFAPRASEARRLALARWLTAGLGALATATSVGLATFDIGSLWDAFQGMMGLLGGGLAGLFALGVFFPRATGRGALTGAVTSVLVLYWVQEHTDLHFFLYGAVGILTCVGVGLLSSFLPAGGARSNAATAPGRPALP